ncbi:MAG TPA: hypothetical protein VH231_13515 [Solirubrobacteraceae bacterium]|jgi:hypothetical protein|nr:hypothetical protein [Solirubrobacteraceae bacterium]
MRRVRDGWIAWSAPGCLRWAAGLSLGLLVVHQLRLLAAPSSDGHTPLLALAVPVGVLLMGAAVALAVELARIRRGCTAAPGRLSLRRVWIVATVALVALFVAQELLEGALLSGHAGGLVGVFGLGGWTALPLAVAVGGLVALALAGVHSVLRRAAADPLARRAPHPVPKPRTVALWRPAGVLACKLASRAPPTPAA